MANVLIANHYDGVIRLLYEIVTGAGHHIAAQSRTAAQVIVHYSECLPDIAILDHHLPDFNGLFAAERIFGLDPNAKLILLVDFERETYIRNEVDHRIVVMNKPFDLDGLLRVIDELLSRP